MPFRTDAEVACSVAAAVVDVVVVVVGVVIVVVGVVIAVAPPPTPPSRGAHGSTLLRQPGAAERS